MKKESLELKVGVFVLVGLIILGILVFKAGDFYLKPGYTIHVYFDYITGIEKGAPVRLAGVDVGEVTEIHVLRNTEGETRVEVLCRIDQGVYVEEDAEVRINSVGLIAEKYIEILPGTSGVKGLENGGSIQGRTPIILEKITESGTRLISKMESAMDNINDVVSDAKFKDSFKGTFTNASTAFESADKVMRNLSEATDDIKDAAKSTRIVMARVRDGEGTIGKLLKDDKIAQELEAFVKDIKAHPWKLLKKN